MDWGEGEYDEQTSINTKEGKEELCTEGEEEDENNEEMVLLLLLPRSTPMLRRQIRLRNEEKRDEEEDDSGGGLHAGFCRRLCRGFSADDLASVHDLDNIDPIHVIHR